MYPALITDNALYSANEGAFSSDYREIDSTILSNHATTLMKSDYHYEVEHTYEFTGTTNSTEVSYYAEVGPLQEVSLLIDKCTYSQTDSYCTVLHGTVQKLITDSSVGLTLVLHFYRSKSLMKFLIHRVCCH